MSARADDGLFDEWVERGRVVTVRGELERRGLWSRKMLGDAGNPCPGCGGRDRFAVNLRKNLFVCRRSGVGGDAIALVRHIEECSFLRAVEILTGEAPPTGEAEDAAERAARVTRMEARARAQAEDARRQQLEGERYRAMERKAAFEILLSGQTIKGTPAEAYLKLRGLEVPRGARLRYHPDLPFYLAGEYDTRQEKARRLFSGPALLGGIQDAAGAYIGVHRTWIDLDQPNGKRAIFHPETGEALKAKKSRGSVRGGMIWLAGHPEPRQPHTAWRMIMGEGIETTLSPYTVMTPAERAGTVFAAGVSLGNIAGKAAGRVLHPTETVVDGKGRRRRRFVGDDVPDPADDTPLIHVPDSVTELVLLGDGDSDAFATELAMRRSGMRYADGYPGVTVRLAMARAGFDFNKMLMEAA